VAELTAEQRLIFNGVKDTTRLLVLGWLLALGILAVKLLTRQETVSVAGIDLPVRYAWVAFGLFTAAHVFKGGFLFEHITAYRAAPAAEKRALFAELRAETNPLLHGLLPRGRSRGPGQRLTKMDPRDPSSWMAYAGQLTVFVAVLPWSLSGGGVTWPHGWSLWLQVIGAVALAEVNWLVGSRWLVALASLGEGTARVQDSPSTVSMILTGLALIPLAGLVLVVALPALLLWVLWDLARGRRPRIREFLDFHS